MYQLSKTKSIAITGILASIILLLFFTPLGFIPLPFMRATTVHIPVIIGSLLLGPKYGAFLGFLFGFTSLYMATTVPLPTSFVFSPFLPVPGTGQGSPWALVVVFVPRILVGVVPWCVYTLLGKVLPERMHTLSLALTGVAGSMTNTLLVMHAIFVLFREPWAEVRGDSIDAVYGVILGIIAINGIPEAIVAGVLVTAVGSAIFSLVKKYGYSE